MNKWIVYSLKYRKGQAGFALPVAIGMGLIILLVGLTMLLRSQDSQVSAIAQKDTAKSLNAAETGVNEIRALINDYRELALFSACNGGWDIDDICPDSSSVKSWKNPSKIANPFLGCAPDDNSKIATIAKRTVWHDVDSDDPSQGEYRLLDYDYASDVGTLTVQGRVNAGQPSESISQLQVKFPVDQPPSSPNDITAGLWVQTSANTDKIQTDVLGECNSLNTAPLNPKPVFKSRELDLSAAGIAIPQVPQLPLSSSLQPTPLTSLPPTLPLALDDPHIDDPVNNTKTYRYVVDDLDGDFKVDNDIGPLKIVEIWVNGDINIQGHKFRNICSSRPNCNAHTVKIYGLGNNKSISLDKGSVVCDVFIHAPSYDVTNNSSGSSPTDSSLPLSNEDYCSLESPSADLLNPSSYYLNTGVFWVDSWTDSGAVRTPVLNPPRAVWSQTSISMTYPPQLLPIQSWVTQKKNGI